MTRILANTSVYHSGWCEEYLMGVYIIRPKTTSVAHSLKLASRKFTRESRPSQVAEVVNFWQQDPVYQEISSYLEDTDKITQYPTYSNITGSKVVDIPDEEFEQIRQDLPNALILRDQPIQLIQPERNNAASKDTLSTDDLWHLEAISLNLARQQGFSGTGKDITVAVLDTGIDETHTALKGKVAASYSLNNRTQQIQPISAQDTEGHGTHVAGLICSQEVGVAPETKLISGILIPGGSGNLSDLFLWLDWLAMQPEVNIVNISAGIPIFIDGISDLIDSLLAVGILPVCAVGNDGINRTDTPANCRGSLSVGAINSNYQVAAFSGSGTIAINNHQYQVPYLVAPGKVVYSSVMGGGYEAWDGTSMATPIVSGVAALILEKYQKITYLDLVNELLSTCKDLGLDKERQGKGLVQVPKALYEP
ncbi:S8 family peptidase [Anabaena sp. UHCC 0451]|uniref:S8 family peptidase n=1 Tax=Anabaena sp. UHCC 0451 TaxID=2055235 RepID=UPI002B219C7D|nr:S8 family serine peptidase [Anabaena sp. UHCC 0451]MEA5579637.1 S8 family serine peptidase [Anabaena sp. UHCC 0451]